MQPRRYRRILRLLRQGDGGRHGYLPVAVALAQMDIGQAGAVAPFQANRFPNAVGGSCGPQSQPNWQGALRR